MQITKCDRIPNRNSWRHSCMVFQKQLRIYAHPFRLCVYNRLRSYTLGYVIVYTRLISARQTHTPQKSYRFSVSFSAMNEHAKSTFIIIIRDS